MSKKRKKVVQIKINFTNRWLYTLIALGILVLAAVGVYAANTLLVPGTAPKVGHTTSQLSPPSGCSPGQLLQWNGTANGDGGWACVDGTSGGLYGICQQYSDPYSSGCSAQYPAYCSNNQCACPSNYLLNSTGIYSYQTWYTCYKI